MVQLASCNRGTVLHYPFKQRDHNTCRARAGYITGIRIVLLQDVTVIIRHFGDKARLYVNAVVGKYRKRGSLLVEREIGCAESYGQKGRQGRGDAEAASVLGDGRHAELLRQLDGGNVARLGQRMPERDQTFKAMIKVMRRVGSAGTVKRGGLVQNFV